MIPSQALAQATGAPPASGNPMISMVLQALYFLPIFLILYFLLIRPQQQQKKQAERMVAALKKGDRVLTNGGIFGTVLGVDDHRVVLKIADDTKVEFAKSAVVQVLKEDARS